MTSIVTIIIVWIMILAVSSSIIMPFKGMVTGNTHPEVKITAIFIIYIVGLITIGILGLTVNVVLHIAPLLIFSIELFIGWCFIAFSTHCFREKYAYNDKVYVERDKVVLVITIIIISSITMAIMRLTYGILVAMDYLN